MSKPTSLMKLEDTVIQSNDFDNLRIPGKNEFYPTDASYVLDDGTVIGKCLRSLFLARAGMQKAAYGVRTLHTFALGHNIEDHTIESHKSAGIFVAREISYTMPVPPIVINGRMDEIVILDGKYVGVEIKSGHGYNFIKQHVTGYKRKPTKNSQPHLIDQTQSSPQPEHLLQAGLYLLYTQEMMPLLNGIKIDEWRLYYRAVDNKVGAEYQIKLEENGGLHKIKLYKLYISSDESDRFDDYEEIMIKDIYIEPIIDRFKQAYLYINNNIIPRSDYKNTEPCDWQCNYCPYQELCKKLPQEEVDGSVLNVVKSPLYTFDLQIGG